MQWLHNEDRYLVSGRSWYSLLVLSQYTFIDLGTSQYTSREWQVKVFEPNYFNKQPSPLGPIFKLFCFFFGEFVFLNRAQCILNIASLSRKWGRGSIGDFLARTLVNAPDALAATLIVPWLCS